MRMCNDDDGHIQIEKDEVGLRRRTLHSIERLPRISND